MSSVTLSIMEEFLRSGEPQARKNALTALSVVGDDDSARLMAERALADDDAGVRERALAEIATLGESARLVALHRFAEALRGEDEKQQQRSYALLGRLKSKGVAVGDVWLPRGSGMRLATSLVSRAYLSRNWLSRLRGWRYGFWGTLGGIAVFIIYAVQAYHVRRWMEALGLALIALGAVAIGTLLAIFATQFSTPINLQLSRLHALFVELITSFIGSVVGLMLLYTLVGGLLHTLLRIDSEFIFLLFIPLCGLLAAAVRFGTIIGFACVGFNGQSKTKRRQLRLVEVLYGTITGFFSTSVVFFIYWLQTYRFDYMSGVGRDNTALWLISLALAVGLANAFAKIDSEAPAE